MGGHLISCVLALILMASQGAAQGLPEKPPPLEPLWPDLPPAENVQGDDPSVGPPPELPAQVVPEYRPPAPEVPMVDLPPEELPEPEGPPLSASDPTTRFRSYNSQMLHGALPQPVEHDPIQEKLPPGYAARSECLKEEEEIENGAAHFGIEPSKMRWGDQWISWIPKICRQRGDVR